MVARSGRAGEGEGGGERDRFHLSQRPTARARCKPIGGAFSDSSGNPLQWTRATVSKARVAFSRSPKQALDSEHASAFGLWPPLRLAARAPFSASCAASVVKRWRRRTQMGPGERVCSSSLALGSLAHCTKRTRICWRGSGGTSPYHECSLESR